MTAPKKINAQRIREWVDKSDLTYTQIYQTLGYPEQWFGRMIMPNPRYRFINPNPERMKRIFAYVQAYTSFYHEKQYKFREFQKKWL